MREGARELLLWCRGAGRARLVRSSCLPPGCVSPGAEFEGASLFQLSNLKTELTRLTGQFQTSCPRPERDLLQAVVSEWQRVLDRDIEQMMGGEVA